MRFSSDPIVSLPPSSTGDTDPQTLFESRQNSNTTGRVFISQGSKANMRQVTLHPAEQFLVCHVWKANKKFWGIRTTHHSHIQIKLPMRFRPDGVPFCHVGMFTRKVDEHGIGKRDNVADPATAQVIVAPGEPASKYGYNMSTTYKPNPVTVRGADIQVAFQHTLNECAVDYGILDNNCQKFARLFMTKLGAKHHRHALFP